MARDVKLQLLLTKEGARPENVQRLERELGENSLRLTGRGAATVSAIIADTDFVRVFGRDAPAVQAGFATSFNEPNLSVPESMKDLVAEITLVPRHERM